MNGQARALIDSMPNDIGTEAVGPLSFDEAFTLHHRAVFRTARAVVRDSALAEDVTQEVFLRLYRNLNSTPGEELLRAWLLRVTLNVARNTLRGQSRSMVRDNEYHKSTAERLFCRCAGRRLRTPPGNRRSSPRFRQNQRADEKLPAAQTTGTLIPRDRHQFVAQRDKHRQPRGARAQRVCEGLR